MTASTCSTGRGDCCRDFLGIESEVTVDVDFICDVYRTERSSPEIALNDR